MEVAAKAGLTVYIYIHMCTAQIMGTFVTSLFTIN